jgi:hypothetical protein
MRDRRWVSGGQDGRHQASPAHPSPPSGDDNSHNRSAESHSSARVASPSFFETLAGHGICPIFTVSQPLRRDGWRSGGREKLARKTAPVAAFTEIRCGNCTKSGHPPVDGLHSIEKSRLTNWHFSLTQKIEGVKQDRSLTASEFFRLVRRPGLKRNHFFTVR